MKLMIISGRSGSGKSVALHALEDMGFYCVDNLPIILLPQLAETLAQRNLPAAISIDVRNLPDTPELLDDALKQLPAHFSPQLLFLDADRSTLIRRYSETRRVHPLSNQHLLLEAAIDKENNLLAPLRQSANLIIDTTQTSVHELASILRNRLYGNKKKELTIIIESFGFKYGLPLATDYLFDVRFLPNPHWEFELRSLTGLDKPVQTFLEKHNEVYQFIYQTRNYLTSWLPLLENDNRSYLTISIGCTGGKHRSVYIVEQLANYFRSCGRKIQVRHRTLQLPENQSNHHIDGQIE